MTAYIYKTQAKNNILNWKIILIWRVKTWQILN